MRRLYNIACVVLLLAVTLPAITGCTRMDGDIGHLFGRWNLTSLTADGEEVPLYRDGTAADDVLLYTWSFQGDLAWILTLYPYNDYKTAKGMWSRTDTQLTLDFSHSDNDGDEFYTPPQPLHLEDVTTLNIESLSSSAMTLWYVSDDDIRYEYHLIKAY